MSASVALVEGIDPKIEVRSPDPMGIWAVAGRSPASLTSVHGIAPAPCASPIANVSASTFAILMIASLSS